MIKDIILRASYGRPVEMEDKGVSVHAIRQEAYRISSMLREEGGGSKGKPVYSVAHNRKAGKVFIIRNFP